MGMRRERGHALIGNSIPVSSARIGSPGFALVFGLNAPLFYVVTGMRPGDFLSGVIEFDPAVPGFLEVTSEFAINDLGQLIEPGGPTDRLGLQLVLSFQSRTPGAV